MASGNGTKKLTMFEHGRAPHLIGDEILIRKAARSKSQKIRRQEEAEQKSPKRVKPATAKGKKRKVKVQAKSVVKRARRHIDPEPSDSESDDDDSELVSLSSLSFTCRTFLALCFSFFPSLALQIGAPLKWPASLQP